MAWIGVDLDGTLAEYHGWSDEIGPPVPLMVATVKRWLSRGYEVRILTARGFSGKLEHDADQQAKIVDWCIKHLGKVLMITDHKDMHMALLFDDRAVGIEKNTGRMLSNPQYAIDETV